MKVLFLTPRFPHPPHRGDRLTAHELLRALSARHDVTLVSFVDGSEPSDAPRAIGRWCRRVETVHLSPRRSWAQAWGGLLSSTPSQVSYYRSRKMSERVASVFASDRWDVVFVQLFRMAPFARFLEHPAKVLYLADSMNLALERQSRHQPLWKRPGVAWERARVARFEVEATRWFRESWVVSAVDARDLEARGAHALRVLAHGVDERLFDLPIRPAPARRAVFLGNLGVPHNVDGALHLVRSLWPRIRAEVPDAELILAGADPREEVRRLAQTPGVRVTGALEDLVPLWRDASLLLVPLRHATGIQNKVLEAMAAGVPVVTTPAVADGIEAKDDVHLVVRSDPADLAGAAVRLLREPASALERSARARAFVRERFSWQNMVARLEDLAGARADAALPQPRMLP